MKLQEITFVTAFYETPIWDCSGLLAFCHKIWQVFKLTPFTSYKVAIHDRCPTRKPRVQRRKVALSQVDGRFDLRWNKRPAIPLSFFVVQKLKETPVFRKLTTREKTFWLTLQKVKI